MTDTSRLYLILAATLAACTSITLIAGKIWFWTLIDILTPFVAPFVLLALWIAFGAAAFVSLVHAACNNRERVKARLIPLSIQIIALIALLTVPFTRISISHDFNSKLSQREQIVGMIAMGELQPNVSYNTSLITLPQPYRYLSKGGGEVMSEKHGDTVIVFFFTFRGILDNFSGFMYRSDDSQPGKHDFGGDFFEIKHFKTNWYWVASS